MESQSSDPHQPRDPADRSADALRAGVDAALEPALREAFPDPVYTTSELMGRAAAARTRGDGLAAGDRLAIPLPASQDRFFSFTRWMRYGVPAIMLVLIAVGIPRIWHRVSAPPTMSRLYTTKAGEEVVIQLADGSRITLAPRTQLTVNEANGSIRGTTGRRVVLAGEAHFEIASRSDAPFIVQTGAVSTRVLGTTFDVRRYADDETGQVFVHSGKVMTVSRGHSALLSAGMVGVFTDSTVMSGMAREQHAYTDWAHNQLVFQEAEVPDVFAALHRWYGYEFKLTDSTLARQHVTGVFPLGEASTMLRLVKRVLGVSLTFQDSVVILHPDRDARQPYPAAERSVHDTFHAFSEVGR